MRQCHESHQEFPPQPVSLEDLDLDYTSETSDSAPVRPLYIVTPTYTRAAQLADLTRLANTLRLVAGAHWIIAEVQH